ncbi:BACON domain-containing protein [Bacteroides bouchesdurhonensis]
MKKYIYYIVTLFFLQAVVGACTDTEIYDTSDNSKGSQLKIVLNVPVDNARTRGLVHGPDEDPTTSESVINDVYVLAFNKASNKYLGKFQPSMSNNTLIASIDIEKIGTDEITALVLTNLNSLENGSELVNKINQLTTGQTKEQLLKSLVYTFNNIWSVNERPLPMWGETDITPVKESTVTGTVNLYRAVSKINVTFNGGKQQLAGDNKTEIFKLKSVRVYYARTSGLAGSLHTPIHNEEGGSDLIGTPSIPDEVNYFPRYKEDGTPNNLLFETTSEDGDYAIENQIYVPESDQDQTDEPMCLVIGGYYMGSDKETFYRVDFKQGNKGTEYYDAIRNHIYNFNINTVTRPGTDEPDPALDHVVVGMDVTITDWTTEWMRGIGGQYTLEVSTGGFVVVAEESQNTLKISTTHSEPWSIESKNGNWFDYQETADGITIKTKKNSGGERFGSFIVKSGNLQKEITIRQRGKGTANCYIVSDNGEKMEQGLIVTVKGNGEVGLVADGVPLVEKDPYISVDAIGDVQIIWETAEGLVTIVQENGKAKLDKESGIINYKIDLSKENKDIQASNTLNKQNYKGGNALIGAFGKNSDGSVDYNNLLWTWHIWVCPELDTNQDGLITDSELRQADQKWVTGYTFMDRNMGALSNTPGLSSLGLLYQWGRKDPFIGAAKVAKSANKMETYRPLIAQGYDWKTSKGKMSISQTVKAPMTLINGIIDGTDYKSLWGTATGLKGEANAGNKTIYDPCPYGYRVPNVAAIVFKSGYHKSENENWYDNVRFWPYTTEEGDYWDYYIQVTGKNSYGFWLQYTSNDSYKGTTYEDGDYNNTQNINNKSLTWLPLSGVYDGNISNFADVDNQSSLLVNGIMWTNSSVTVNKIERPAALFLHGVQDNESVDGNHLHKLNTSEDGNRALYAKPEHAGALRCVRDVKVDMGEENAIKLPDEIKLAATVGDRQTGELTSLLDDWEVVDPGAMWFDMTPDAGSTGSKQTLTFTSTKVNVSSSRSAYIKIKFNDGKGTVKQIKVTQAGLNKTDHSVTTPISFTNSGNQTKTGDIVAIDDGWEIISGQNVDWLSISPTRSESLNDGGTPTITYTATKANTTHSPRSTTLVVRFGNGNTQDIVVSQEGAKYTLEVSETSMSFERDPYSSKSFDITSDTKWTISTNRDWIKVNSTSGNGNKSGITVTCNKNENKRRSGTITITTTDGISKKISVTQKGK